MGVRVGVGVLVAVGEGMDVGVAGGLAIMGVDVVMRVGDVVGVGVDVGVFGSGATVVVVDRRVARFASGVGVVGVGGCAGVVWGAGDVGVGGWRSDSRMIVKVGVGCGVMMGAVAGPVWVMGAGVGVGGVGAPPQFSRVRAVSSVVARDRAARIFG